VYLYDSANNQPIEQYPVRHIKITSKHQVNDNLQKKLYQTWKINDIHLQDTLNLLKDGAGKENWLDSSRTTEIAFRTKVIFNKLPSMTQVSSFKPQIKVACLQEPETQDHIWTCPETVKNREKVLQYQINGEREPKVE
jgi:hypothetical protein